MMDALAQYWSELERQRGLPPGYLSRTRQIESSGNPMAVSPTGATGPFQFTKGTAKAMNLPLDQRTDEYASARAAADYAAQNNSILSKALGRPPSGAELYLAHQQGGGGATSLLTQMNMPAGQATAANNIAVNSGDPNKPASEFVNKFIAKYNQSKPGDNMGQGPTVAAAAGGATPGLAPAVIGPNGVPAGMSYQSSNGMPAPVIGEGKGLVGMAMSDKGITGAGLKSFMGGGEMAAGMKGLGMLAAGMQGAPAPPPPPPMQAEPENRGDVSLLSLIDPKKKRAAQMAKIGGMI